MLHLSSGSPMSSLLVKNNKVLTQAYQGLQVLTTATCQMSFAPTLALAYCMPATMAIPLFLKYDNLGSVLRTSLCLAQPPLESDSYLPSFPYSNVNLDTLDLSFPI